MAVHHEERSQARQIISLENDYPEQVAITHICVYFYKKPWKGVCQKVTGKKPGFVFRHGKKPGEVQRIALFGKNLIEPTGLATCLVYYNYRRHSAFTLSNHKHYLVRVDYVTGDDMVCSMETVE